MQDPFEVDLVRQMVSLILRQTLLRLLRGLQLLLQDACLHRQVDFEHLQGLVQPSLLDRCIREPWYLPCPMLSTSYQEPRLQAFLLVPQILI